MAACPCKQLKICSVGFQYPMSAFRQHLFSLAFINKNLLYFHTSKYGRRDGFPHQHSHLGTPWWAPPTFSAISNHRQLVTTSHVIPHLLLSFQSILCLASNIPFTFSLPHYKQAFLGFLLSSHYSSGKISRNNKKTPRNFIALFKLFLKSSSLSGRLQ